MTRLFIEQPRLHRVCWICNSVAQRTSAQYIILSNVKIHFYLDQYYHQPQGILHRTLPRKYIHSLNLSYSKSVGSLYYPGTHSSHLGGKTSVSPTLCGAWSLEPPPSALSQALLASSPTPFPSQRSLEHRHKYVKIIITFWVWSEYKVSFRAS